MNPMRRLTTADLALLLLVLLLAAGARAWYVSSIPSEGLGEAPLQVQDAWPTLQRLPPNTEMHGHKPPNELDALLHNLKESNWFGSLAPLAATEERTAHVSPGYPRSEERRVG